MKNLKTALLAASVLIISTGAISAQSTETRTVHNPGAFEAINIAGTQTVHFEIGPSGDPFTIIGEPQDLDNMEIKVVNGTLSFGYKKGYKTRNPKSTQVYVKNETLKAGSVSGTGTLNISGTLDDKNNNFSVSGTGRVVIEKIECGKLSCTVSGTGSIRCPSVEADNISAKVSGTGRIEMAVLDSDVIDLKTSGTGRIEISGQCVTATMTSSGTGGILAGELKADKITASTSGTGSIYCRATDRFEGRASGTGKVYLYGNPETVKFSGKTGKLVQR